MSTKRLLLILPLALVVAVAALSAPAVLAQLALDHDHRAVPGTERWRGWLLVLGWSAPLVYVIVLATVARPALATIRGSWRAFYVLGTTLLQLAAVVSSFALLFNTDPHAFGGQLISAARSPDGQHTAYLYDGGMMCGFDVFVARAGDHVMPHVHTVGMSCGDVRDSHLVWTSDQALEIRNERGSVTGPFPIRP